MGMNTGEPPRKRNYRMTTSQQVRNPTQPQSTQFFQFLAPILIAAISGQSSAVRAVLRPECGELPDRAERYVRKPELRLLLFTQETPVEVEVARVVNLRKDKHQSLLQNSEWRGLSAREES